MLDLLGKSGCNEALLNEGMVLDGALPICLQKLQVLDEVGAFLVVLAVSVHASKEPPVVKVIDSILKDGICCPVAPEVTMEPGGEWLHWLVRGIVRGGVQLNDPCLLLSPSSAVKSSDPSIVELLDKAGKPFGSIIEGDSEVWEVLPVLLISRWTFAEAIVIIVHPLLKYCNVSLKPLDFLPMDIISDPDGGGKPSNNGPELVQGQIRCGSKDVLHRGGREGEPPGVSGGKSNSCTLFSDFAHLKGIVQAEAKMSWEVVSGLFRG